MNYKPSILVIDDETVVCDSCNRLFSQSGYTVDTNVNPDQGFHQALVNHYDAIILDLKLGEQDGIQLLYGIREKNPEVPVVIITGYPTEESKQMSEKLGVSDYITKPFDPDRILESVKRITLKDFSAPKVSTVIKKSIPDSSECRFFKGSWFYRLSENSVRAGGHLPSTDTDVITVRLPEPGEQVYRGLPLAELTLSDDTRCIIHSPVTGKISEVNTVLKAHPELLGKSINKNSWIAQVQTENMEQDVEASEVRKLLYLSKRIQETHDNTGQFAELGYVTRSINSFNKTVKILTEEKIKVVVADAQSFIPDGPEIVKRLNNEFPDVNIIVLNESNAETEIFYRQNRIFYYGVNPVSNREMSDILFCAFNDQNKTTVPRIAVTGFLPNTISRIRITNRQGDKVSLFAFNEILQNDQGAGSMLIRQLLYEAYPVEITHTPYRKSCDEDTEILNISREKEQSNRIIVLRAGDMNKIPGSITRDIHDYRNSRGSGKKIITVTVQPAASEKVMNEIDTDTANALADFLKNEMTSE
jgi:DNA-binding response OmpR family regulator